MTWVRDWVFRFLSEVLEKCVGCSESVRRGGGVGWSRGSCEGRGVQILKERSLLTGNSDITEKTSRTVGRSCCGEEVRSTESNFRGGVSHERTGELGLSPGRTIRHSPWTSLRSGKTPVKHQCIIKTE